MNGLAHEKVLVLFQESFNATTIFLQLRHFLLDIFQEVRVGPIKCKRPHMASTCCCDQGSVAGEVQRARFAKKNCEMQLSF